MTATPGSFQGIALFSVTADILTWDSGIALLLANSDKYWNSLCFGGATAQLWQLPRRSPIRWETTNSTRFFLLYPVKFALGKLFF